MITDQIRQQENLNERMIEAKALAMLAETAFIVYLNEQEKKKCGHNLKTK